MVTKQGLDCDSRDRASEVFVDVGAAACEVRHFQYSPCSAVTVTSSSPSVVQQHTLERNRRWRSRGLAAQWGHQWCELRFRPDEGHGLLQ